MKPTFQRQVNARLREIVPADDGGVSTPGLVTRPGVIRLGAWRAARETVPYFSSGTGWPEMRGQSSEPIELRPGISARQAARVAEVEQWAWRRVRSLRAFYTHVTVYLVANFVLLLIDVSTLGEPWFYKPLLAWGLVLALHAAQAYEMLPWLSQDWEQRKVRELMERRLGE
jgi:hypothetical protein